MRAPHPPPDHLPCILHADLDAFYASVEQLLDPALRGLPIAVGGGVVLAASYEARRYGVQGGMSGRQARQLCPRLRFVPGHFAEYVRLGDAVMKVLERFTPLVERISIDEAFLDVRGSVHLFGHPAHIAARLRHEVRGEVGLPISVGVASTKHLAKVASQVAKPDGLVVVPSGGEREFLAPLPVGLLWGVGPVTRQRLAARGIRTIGQLAEVSPDSLQSWLGTALGGKVRALAANDDRRRVRSGGHSGSVGAQSAFARCEPTPEHVRAVLGHLADRVAGRLRARGRAGHTVTVRVRVAAGSALSRSLTCSRTGPAPVDATLTLTEIAEALAWQALAACPAGSQVSLLAVSVSHLVDQASLQLELPFDADAERAGHRWAVDRSVDAVRRRFGRDAIGYAPTALASHASVPDEFRALAEKSH